MRGSVAGCFGILMHPIDQAIADMQARRRARTWPPVTLQEFAALSRDELQALAQQVGVNAISNRQVLIIELYQAVHCLDEKMRRST